MLNFKNTKIIFNNAVKYNFKNNTKTYKFIKTISLFGELNMEYVYPITL